MGLKIKLGTLSKSVFAVVAVLVFSGVSILGLNGLSVGEDSRRIHSVLVENGRREAIKDFLYTNINWAGRPASTTAFSFSILPLMMRDLPGFWRDAELVRNSLAEFSKSDKLLEESTCRAHLELRLRLSKKRFEDIDIAEEMERVRSPIVKAANAIEDVMQWSRRRGVPNNQAAELSLDTLAYFSQLRNDEIVAIRNAASDVRRWPGNWFCWENSLSPLIESADGERRPRMENDLNFRFFLDALSPDSYGMKLRNMNPKEFERHYFDEEKALVGLLNVASDTSPLKVVNWLPAFPRLDWSKVFPWIVFVGMLLVVILVRRFSVAMDGDGIEVDLEDPGFPSSFVLSTRIGSGILDRFISWIILFAPAGVGGVLLINQNLKAESYMKLIPEKVDAVLGLNAKYYAMINVISKSIEPTQMQAVGMVFALIFSLIAIIRIEMLLSKIDRAIKWQKKV